METNIELLKNIAPTLAVAIEGPFISVASKFIIDKLAGGQADKTKSTDDIIDDLLKDTENLKKIKILDEQFKLEMKSLDINVFALKSTDNIKALKVVKANMLPQTIISSLFFIAYFILAGVMFFVEISDTLNMERGENSLRGELQILFGVLTAGVVQILGFWFSNSPKIH